MVWMTKAVALQWIAWAFGVVTPGVAAGVAGITAGRCASAWRRAAGAAAVGSLIGVTAELVHGVVRHRVLYSGTSCTAPVHMDWADLLVTIVLAISVVGVAGIARRWLSVLASDMAAGIIAAVCALVALAHPMLWWGPVCGDGIYQLMYEHLW
jgi:hypothetical protein